MSSDEIKPAAVKSAITTKIVLLRVGAPVCHINEPLCFNIVYLSRQRVSEQ